MARQPKTATPEPTQARRRRLDWEAIERDYRTGKFTLRELEAKHGTNNATIARKIKSDRAADPTRWQQDLTKAVRQATSAKLMEELVSKEVSRGQQEVSNTVLAAAEVSKQVILKHRAWLARLAEDTEAMRQKVVSLMSGVADVKEAAVAVSAVESLARTTKLLIDKERQAFTLDDVQPSDEAVNLRVEFIEPDAG